VGTEDPEIVDVVRSFGGQVVLTAQHPTGTDRVAEVAKQFPAAKIVVNLQGDEPEIAPSAIDAAIRSLNEHPSAVMSTLAAPIRHQASLDDPSCVKVVFAADGRALCFSRSPIPYVRDRSSDWLKHDPPVFYQHVGLYAYRADFLQLFAEWPPSQMEQVECLEQLRVLEAGREIQVQVIPRAHKGIDTLDDYRAFVARANDH
jgi:3-deoxy-manno-octulosonate cytidylyltransferase (CMP-KDO synthetase)